MVCADRVRGSRQDRLVGFVLRDAPRTLTATPWSCAHPRCRRRAPMTLAVACSRLSSSARAKRLEHRTAHSRGTAGLSAHTESGPITHREREQSDKTAPSADYLPLSRRPRRYIVCARTSSYAAAASKCLTHLAEHDSALTSIRHDLDRALHLACGNACCGLHPKGAAPLGDLRMFRSSAVLTTELLALV